MKNVVVVDNPESWPFKTSDVQVISAQAYLTETAYTRHRGMRVYNLCRSYRYQSNGYYVSLLALARGHKPFPSITTIQDMRNLAVAKAVADELTDDINRQLKQIRSSSFTLSVYFGRNLAERYEAMSARLFRTFPTPFLRAEFARTRDYWSLHSLRPIGASEIPESHHEFVIESARRFFDQRRLPRSRNSRAAYDVAILVNPDESMPPSNRMALRRFGAAGRRLGMEVELIERDDLRRVAEFDALFIRETTSVDHYTYRFARRAAAEGLFVIDDADSILRCTNKVFIAELLSTRNVPIPRTMIVHRNNRGDIAAQLGLPCVLKLPDSSFSQGVEKAETPEELQLILDRMFTRSDLVIGQQFVPTDFDWRIGVLNREPLYACKYYMVKAHWQIYKSEARGTANGEADAIAIAEVPSVVLRTAVRAARLIGDGFYGVDVKQLGGKAVVMEINDNPSIDAGVEDRVLGQALYDRIMSVFLERLDQRTRPRAAKGKG